MFYAHEGSRTDNAFTLGIDNKPIRIFRAFNTKAERTNYREKIWKAGDNNLIDCDRKTVVIYLGRMFRTYLSSQDPHFLCAASRWAD